MSTHRRRACVPPCEQLKTHACDRSLVQFTAAMTKRRRQRLKNFGDSPKNNKKNKNKNKQVASQAVIDASLAAIEVSLPFGFRPSGEGAHPSLVGAFDTPSDRSGTYVNAYRFLHSQSWCLQLKWRRWRFCLLGPLHGLTWECSSSKYTVQCFAQA